MAACASGSIARAVCSAVCGRVFSTRGEATDHQKRLNAATALATVLHDRLGIENIVCDNIAALISDNPDIVANLYGFFEPKGHHLDSASNGYAGLTEDIRSGDMKPMFDAIRRQVQMAGGPS